MPDIFLSHSVEDRVPAERVTELLRGGGHRVFLDSSRTDGIASGADWRETLFHELRMAHALVLLNSAASRASRWCHTEIGLALERGKPIHSIDLTPHEEPHPLLEAVQSVSLQSSLEESVTRVAAVLRDTLGSRPTWDRSRSPYPGLHSFEAADAAVFFGRDADTDRILERIGLTLSATEGRLVTITGASGTGKSSVLKAGVLPALARRPEWCVVGPFEPRRYPLLELRSAVEAAVPGITADAEDLGLLASRIRGSRPGVQRVLIAVDQTEHLLASDAEQRTGFLTQLADALRPGSPVTVVITVREDRLGTLQKLPPLGALANEPIRIAPLDRAGLAMAIEQPAQVAGMSLGPGLAALLIDDAMRGAADDPGRALPLLAFTLSAMYDRAVEQGLPSMEAELYGAVGRMEGAIAMRAEDVESRLTPQDAARLTGLLTRFVEFSDRQSLSGVPLDRATLTSDEDQLVTTLQDARLLSSDGGSVRLVHERLIEAWPRLAEAIREREAELVLRGQLARRARLWDGAAPERRTEHLLGPETTVEAERLIAADDSRARDESVLTAFVAASRKAWTRTRRRRIVTITTLFSLFAAVTALQIRNGRVSRDAATRARYGELVAKAKLDKVDNPVASAIALITAERLRPGTDEVRKLATDLLKSPLRLTVDTHTRDQGGVLFLAVGNDVGIAAGGGHLERIDLITGTQTEFPGKLAEDVSRLQVAIRSDDRVAAVGDGTNITFWDLAASPPTKLGSLPGWGPSFSADGTMLTTFTPDYVSLSTNYPTLWDVHDPQSPTQARSWMAPRPLMALVAGPDGDAIGLATDGSLVRFDAAGMTHVVTKNGSLPSGFLNGGLALSLDRAGQRALVTVSGLLPSAKIIDTRSGQATPVSPQFPRQTLLSDKRVSITLSFVDDARVIVAADLTGTGFVTDTESAQLTATLEGHVGLVTHIASGSSAAVTAGLDGTLRVWDLSDTSSSATTSDVTTSLCTPFARRMTPQLVREVADAKTVAQLCPPYRAEPPATAELVLAAAPAQRPPVVTESTVIVHSDLLVEHADILLTGWTNPTGKVVSGPSGWSPGALKVEIDNPSGYRVIWRHGPIDRKASMFRTTVEIRQQSVTGAACGLVLVEEDITFWFELFIDRLSIVRRTNDTSEPRIDVPLPPGPAERLLAVEGFGSGYRVLVDGELAATVFDERPLVPTKLGPLIMGGRITCEYRNLTFAVPAPT